MWNPNAQRSTHQVGQTRMTRVDHPPRHAARVSPGRRSGCSAQPVGDHVPAAAPLQAGRALFWPPRVPQDGGNYPTAGAAAHGPAAEADFETPLRQPWSITGHGPHQGARPGAMFSPGVGCLVQRFAGRQVLTSACLGQRGRNATMLFHTYNKNPFRQRVRAFSASRDDSEGPGTAARRRET